MCPQSPSIISRPPGAVQVVQGYEPLLDIGASAHLLSGSYEHTDLPGTDLGKKLFLLNLGLGLMDISYFFSWYALVHELLLQSVIDIEFPIVVGS